MKFFDLFLAFLIGLCLCFWIMNGSIIEKKELAYEKGYDEGTYETVVQCGGAVHTLVEQKCPEIYEKLVNISKPAYAEEQIKELEKKAKRYTDELKQNKGENHL